MRGEKPFIFHALYYTTKREGADEMAERVRKMEIIRVSAAGKAAAAEDELLSEKMVSLYIC